MIYCILGPSGVGKTTIVKRIGLPEIISTTTRDIRKGETQDESYHFVTKSEFDQLDLVERVIYSDSSYGLQTNDVKNAINSDKDYCVVLDRKGCVMLRQMLNDGIKIIYLKAQPKKLVGFMRKRGDDDEQIINRLCNIINDKELDNDDIADFVCSSTDLDVIETQINQYIFNMR